VSSANLTEHALNLNVELGVVIQGGDAPGRAVDHVDALTREGILQRASFGS